MLLKTAINIRKRRHDSHKTAINITAPHLGFHGIINKLLHLFLFLGSDYLRAASGSLVVVQESNEQLVCWSLKHLILHRGEERIWGLVNLGVRVSTYIG